MHVFSALGKEIEDYRQKQKKKAKKQNKTKQQTKQEHSALFGLYTNEENFNLIVVLLICLFHII